MRRATRIAWILAASLAATLPVAAQDAPSTGGIAAPGLGADHPGAKDNGNDGLLVEAPDTQSPAPIMTIDQNAVFLRSDWGLRAKAATEKHTSQIDAENERLISQFAAEEQELTLLRVTLSPEEFRKRADDFDKRVSQARRDTERLNATLDAEVEAERTTFFRAALPVLARIMRERGSLVVLDRSATFVAVQSIDVTDELIQRLNTEIGAGPATEAETSPAEVATPGGGAGAQKTAPQSGATAP